jgi:hypothetical protein
MNPKHPVFIPTKGRSDSRLTIKTFDKIGVPYTIFVEEQEYDAYAEHVDPSRIHVLPHRDKGLTFTRNYIWDFAEGEGYERFWTFDDNIDGLYRLNRNIKTPVSDGTIMRVIEEFASRYTNLPICGMNYFMFASRKTVMPPFYLNTRIYSNMLIETNAPNRDGEPFRNVTYFNDDTDLCLRVLKDGYCTVLFNAFLIMKQTTMTVKGGMTEYYEATDNRREFAEELQRAHPDVTTITEKWGRVHHHVDYRGFKQQLVRRDDGEIPDRVNNFGMVLEERIGDRWAEVPLDCEAES